ncbi:MAG: BatD family protein [Bacteroidales bacterium]|nr:BatD family protein [Bacteroidales bacterium]
MKRILLYVFLFVFIASCEYEVSIESNSSGENISKPDTDKQEIKTDIKFTAEAEKIVEGGEVFQVTYSVNANVSNFSPPNFKNFDVLAGPFTSSSSSTQIINGKRSSKVSNSYIYNISAQTPGTYTISAAEVRVGGNTYKSNTLEIKVIGEAKQNKTNNSNNNKRQISNKDIFLSTEYSSTNVYKGEYIIATTKIYTIKDFQNVSEIKFPDYNGFWSEVLKAPRQLNFKNELINGKKYKSALLKQTLLFAQKPGNYTVSPYEIELQIKKKDGKTRDFFGKIVDNYKLINKKLSTGKQTITVKPLPQPVPDNFSGITGKNIKIEVNIDNNNIKTDESANLQISVSGNGNLYLLNELKLELPEGIKHFKPQVEKTEKYTEKGAYSEKQFNYIIVGNKTGTYSLPAFNFVYFDTKSETYKTVSGKEIKLNVEKGSGYISPEDLDKNKLSKDIRHIKTENPNFLKINSTFGGSFLYYLLFVILLSVFFIFLLIRKKYIAANSDIIKVKKKKAGKVSQKRLKTAYKFMNENNEQAFYKEILTGIWGYLSDKMSVNADSLTNESIQKLLKKRNVSDETISKMMNVIEICGYAQYGPSGDEGKPEKIYEDTAKIINDLEASL